MRLTDFARQLPVEVWDLFQPLLPPVVWCGNGRPPASNSDCLHALFYVLVTGIAWRMLPKGFPSDKTVQRRLKVWLQLDSFRTAWQQLAVRYEALHGINWDQLLLDGAKKPAKKGATRLAPARSIAASAARRSPERVTPVPCHWGRWSLGPTPMRGVKPRHASSASWCHPPRRSGQGGPARRGVCHERKRMALTGSGRHTHGPSGRGSVCTPLHGASASLVWARFAMRSSAAITFWPNVGGCFGVSTGRPAATWRGSKWPPVSSCSARVLSHSPKEGVKWEVC